MDPARASRRRSPGQALIEFDSRAGVGRPPPNAHRGPPVAPPLQPPTAAARAPGRSAAAGLAHGDVQEFGAPKQRHTAHYQDPEEVLILYRYHPRAGLTLPLIGRTHYHDEHFLIVRQPDGTHLHVPEWMTHPESAGGAHHWPPRLPLASLTALRSAVDGVLSLPSGVTPNQGGTSWRQGWARAAPATAGTGRYWPASRGAPTR